MVWSVLFIDLLCVYVSQGWGRLAQVPWCLWTMRDAGLTHTHWSNELTVRQVSSGMAGHFINPVQLKPSHRDGDMDVWGSEYTTPLEKGEEMDVDEGVGRQDEVVESVGCVGLRSRDLPGHSAHLGSNGLRDRMQVVWGHRPRRCVNIHHTLVWQWRTWRQRAKWAGSLGYRWACRTKIKVPEHQQLQSTLTNGGIDGTRRNNKDRGQFGV